MLIYLTFNLKYGILCSMSIKKCTKCKKIRPISEFNKCASTVDKKQTWCKCCMRDNMRKRRSENKELELARARNYLRERRKNDVLFKVRENLRSRLTSLIKSKTMKKDKGFSQYIGCSLVQLKQHLQLNFSEGMSWDNYGDWHIDHIVPLSSAKTIDALFNLCHYTNLQPLWAFDNISKGNKAPLTKGP